MVELDNRRVAKNAVILSLRVAIVSFVSIFTSRVVLESLGIEDYGIYGLVGGIIGMVTFLNGAMGGATSRFITYEIGTGNTQNLRRVFSTSFYIHLLIAVVALIILETFGLWFLHNKLVIPEAKMFEANVVFQFSVASIVVSFTQVPYAATIMAYERMNIYAYFDLATVISKLGIAYLIFYVDSEKLIVYAALNFSISILCAFFYRWYCVHNFDETKLTLRIDRPFAKKMLTFSAFDLYGNMSVMFYLQGVPIILNLFLGVIANAAASISSTVNGVIKGFAMGVSLAFSPQITKQYAAGNITNMESMMCRSMMFTALTFAIIGLPFFVETERLLYVWLGQVPKFTVEFIRMIMVVTLIDYITMSNNRGIHATGNIKTISFISGSFYLMCPFVSYFIMKSGGPAYSPYVVNSIMLTIVSILGFYFIKIQIVEYKIWRYIGVVIRTYGVIAICGAILFLLSKVIVGSKFPVFETGIFESIVILLGTVLFNFMFLSGISYAFVLNQSERIFIKNKIKSVLSKLVIFNIQ